MNDVVQIVVMSVGGGVFGALFSHLTRPRPRRHRGEHRPIWRRGPRVDPYTPTDAPIQELSLDGATREMRGAVTTPEGEQ
ncbi:hypothetical protein ACIP79_00620 [Streptomyces sp. NPDC088747]|uniref:hypothetical protein n=1 Tax=Streptomyces sp. NPDC088747 TaxID=3365886 RepID=UPI003809446D